MYAKPDDCNVKPAGGFVAGAMVAGGFPAGCASGHGMPACYASTACARDGMGRRSGLKIRSREA
jgi:hypothetical protein